MSHWPIKKQNPLTRAGWPMNHIITGVGDSNTYLSQDTLSLTHRARPVKYTLLADHGRVLQTCLYDIGYDTMSRLNGFITPNDHVDQAMQYLTGDEYKLLDFATRHILGWTEKINDRRGCISLSMFENGFTSKEGKEFAGTGLSRQQIINGLKALKMGELLIPVGDPGPKGQCWELSEIPNIEALREYHEERIARKSKRTAKARAALAKKREADHKDSTVDSTPGTADSTGTVDSTTPGTVDSTTPGTVDSTESNTSSNTLSNTHRRVRENNSSNSPLPGDLAWTSTQWEAYRELLIDFTQGRVYNAIEEMIAANADLTPKSINGWLIGRKAPPANERGDMHDVQAELLRVFGVTVATDDDKRTAREVARQLFKAGLAASDVEPFVGYVKRQADDKWRVSMRSLVNNGRVSDYIKHQQNIEARQKDRESKPVPTDFVIDVNFGVVNIPGAMPEAAVQS